MLQGNASEMARGSSASLEADWEGSLLEGQHPLLLCLCHSCSSVSLLLTCVTSDYSACVASYQSARTPALQLEHSKDCCN